MLCEPFPRSRLPEKASEGHTLRQVKITQQ
jgi:hypothetical protein